MFRSESRILRLAFLWCCLLIGGLGCSGSSPSGPTDSGGGGGGGGDGESSYGLIDAALDRGELSSAEALLYKFQSVYEPDQLPSALRGNGAGPAHEALYAELSAVYDQLSAAEIDSLMPYMVPAFVTGSWWDRREARKNRKSFGPPCIPWQSECPILDSWNHVDDPPGRVRVWFESGVAADSIRAQSIAGEMNARIWPSETALMNREPLDDLSWGGSSAVDILVIDLPGGILGWTKPLPKFPPACDQSPTFIEIGRSVSNAALYPTVAHEFFHALQWTYSMSGCEKEYSWMREATATWAQDFVYPSSQLEQTLLVGGMTFPEAFLAEPQRSLDFVTKTGPHQYGAYLFFQYLTKTFTSTWVRTIWEQAGNGTPLVAIRDGLMAAGSTDFSERWPQFTRFLWNEGSEDHFNRWDRMARTPSLAHKIFQPTLSAATHDTIRFDLDLPHLSCSYDRISFPDNSVAGFWFLNGWSFDLHETTTGGFQGRVGYELSDLTPDESKLRSVQLLYRMTGETAWRYQDLTTDRAFYFCRDQVSGRVDEAVLIFSNSDPMKSSASRTPIGLAPFVWYDGAGCSKWDGTIRQVVDGTPVETVEANLVWKRDMPNGTMFIDSTPPGAGLGILRFLPESGSFNWSVSGGDGSSGCTTDESNSWNPSAFSFGTQMLLFDLVPSGKFADGVMSNVIDPAFRAPVTLHWSCPDPNDNSTETYMLGPIVTDPNGDLPSMSAGGRSIAAVWTSPDGKTTISLSLQAKRDP